MPELHQNPADATTEHLPALDERGAVATRELPVVTEPVPAVAAPPPGVPAAQPSAAAPGHPVAPAGTARSLAHRRSRMRLVAGLLGFVLVGTAAGAGVATVLRSDVAEPKPSPSASASARVIPADVTSVDPVGGTGLRLRNGQWRTVTYRTAAFGNLKPGVGLLLDVGQPRSVTSVTFDAGPGTISLQLMAGDRPGSTAKAFTPVASPVAAQGATTLKGGSVGAHRYWLVWVSQLAPSNGGYAAVLSEPVVRGA